MNLLSIFYCILCRKFWKYLLRAESVMLTIPKVRDALMCNISTQLLSSIFAIKYRIVIESPLFQIIIWLSDEGLGKRLEPAYQIKISGGAATPPLIRVPPGQQRSSVISIILLYGALGSGLGALKSQPPSSWWSAIHGDYSQLVYEKLTFTTTTKHNNTDNIIATIPAEIFEVSCEGNFFSPHNLIFSTISSVEVWLRRNWALSLYKQCNCKHKIWFHVSGSGGHSTLKSNKFIKLSDDIFDDNPTFNV